jgi:hypothetical protein
MSSTQAGTTAIARSKSAPNIDMKLEAPTPTGAQQAATDAIARAQTQTGVPLHLQLAGTLARGAVLHAETSAQIGLASLPFIGQLGTITVHGSAAAPVDAYRSLIGDSSP